MIRRDEVNFGMVIANKAYDQIPKENKIFKESFIINKNNTNTNEKVRI